MIISDVSCQEINQYEELSAKVSPKTSQDGDFRVWFQIPQEQGHLAVSGDPFLAGFLIPCMYAGENLHIEAPISEYIQKAKLLKLHENERVWHQQIGVEAQEIGDQELLEASKIMTEEKFSAYRFYHRNIKPIQRNILIKIRKAKSKLKA